MTTKVITSQPRCVFFTPGRSFSTRVVSSMFGFGFGFWYPLVRSGWYRKIPYAPTATATCTGTALITQVFLFPSGRDFKFKRANEGGGTSHESPKILDKRIGGPR
jgi:hypothetical protein